MTSVGNPLAEFFAENTSTGGKCRVATALAELSPEKAALLTKALDAPDIQHKAIAKTLGKWGVYMGAQSVARHRSGQCRCDRA